MPLHVRHSPARMRYITLSRTCRLAAPGDGRMTPSFHSCSYCGDGVLGCIVEVVRPEADNLAAQGLESVCHQEQLAGGVDVRALPAITMARGEWLEADSVPLKCYRMRCDQ